MGFLNNLGTAEWIIIIFILLMLFGKKKLMEWARGLGESGREIQKAKREFEGSVSIEEELPKKAKRKVKKRKA
ncbi:MAG: twin-arginine translocase TatA/TatE family subunit [Candidatus Roizmanbacteria bacterium]